MANPMDANVGSGMAKMSMDKIAMKKMYDKAVMSAAENGDSVPSFDEWMKSQKPKVPSLDEVISNK
jgi:hypothetical protein